MHPLENELTAAIENFETINHFSITPLVLEQNKQAEHFFQLKIALMNSDIIDIIYPPKKKIPLLLHISMTIYVYSENKI